MIDCGPGSCSGGLNNSAMNKIKKDGVDQEYLYPYKANNQSCH